MIFVGKLTTFFHLLIIQMNLASRCREAITHVAMLRKELKNHERRASESLALQRQQTQRMASNLSVEVSKMSQSWSEDTGESITIDIDKVLKIDSPPPRPSPKVKSSSLNPKGEDAETKEETVSTSPINGGNESEKKSKIVEEKSKSLSTPPEKTADTRVQKESPKVYSTPNKHRSSDRFTPNFDSPKSDEKTDGLFPRSASPKLERTNYNEEFPSDMIPLPQRGNVAGHSEQDEIASLELPGPSWISPEGALQLRQDIVGINNIDAFEASFDTPFPDNFSPGKSNDAEGEERKTGNSSPSETYNPFAESPAITSVDSDEMYRPVTLPLPSPKVKVPSSPDSPMVIRKPTTPEENKITDNKDDVQYHTPPQEKRLNGLSPEEEPKRPDKTGFEAARARFEKALQPRNSSFSNMQNSKSSTQKSGAPSSGNVEKGSSSPGALMKRIQQRRAIKEIYRQQSAPLSSSNQEGGVSKPMLQSSRSVPERITQSVTGASLNSETSNETFDAFGIAGQGEAPTKRAVSRRSVKQPVSYAEPALNTKLRQGHTFFPKTKPKIVSPEQVTLKPIIN